LKPIQTSSRHLAKWFVCVYCVVSLFTSKTAFPADSLKKVRVAFPSIVIDFAPLWIAREKGLFREEGVDAEITYIQGGIRVVQALVSGDVNFGMGTATGAVTARAAGEGIITVAVPMNRLDYAFVSRQPVSRPADLNGKKVGVAGVGGADNFATRVALEKLGINPASVTMLAIGSSADRLAALRAGSVDAAIIGGATFIGSGTGLHKLVDLTELGIEFPMTAIFTANKYAVANRDSVFGFIRGYMRGVRFFQERKGEAIVIAARNLRTSNTDLIERQWQYAKSYMFEKIPYPMEKSFKLVFDLLAPRVPKVSGLRFEDVCDTSFVRELVDKGFFK
jgi:ABC-type nitrate/sulfonate/bicarbonate transport system substrate-binding protein